MNKLYFGDNLSVMREKIADESVDLIYLDPPFNSKATYNLLYRNPIGAEEDAQLRAFKDTWNWEEDGASSAMDEIRKLDVDIFKMLQSFHTLLGENSLMAYIAMMTIRLHFMHISLKSTGSLYLHCDPTASHYLKVVLDTIFGPANFRSEITWIRSKNPKGSQHAPKQYSPDKDTILYYAKSRAAELDIDAIRRPLTREELIAKYDRHDKVGPFTDGPIIRSRSMGPRPTMSYIYNGYDPSPWGWRMEKQKLEELDRKGNLGWANTGKPFRKLRPEDDLGAPVGNCWTDIPLVNPQAGERLPYPTQKPIELLNRIIKASSKPGQLILDPFCGCGTAIHAAEELGREWIGIDVAYGAILVIEDRLKEWLPQAKYKVDGIPYGETAARALARREPHTFQEWAVGRLGGQPRGRGSDKGIDGEIIFVRGVDRYGRGIVSVKGGQNVSPNDVRVLKSVVEREEADLGIFVCLNPPSKDMKIEAQSERIELPGGSRPKIQIVTVADLFAGPNLGILTELSVVEAARAARKEARKRLPKRPSPEELRNRPPLPPMPIAGGKKDAQKMLPFDEPVLVHPRASIGRKVKRR
jgi:site-specific DNA-methyltransferase (adenine-specific)